MRPSAPEPLLASQARLLPGPGAVYLAQSLSFKRPVKLGAEVVTRVEVVALDPEKARVSLACACTVDGKVVLDGEALIMAPRKPA